MTTEYTMTAQTEPAHAGSVQRIVSLPDVIHQREAPHTGAQRCNQCGGWILSAQTFWTNSSGPTCPTCYRQANAELCGSAAKPKGTQ